MTPLKTSKTTARRGVALLLVLGMLSLMMIMATAFSVMMRTEHAGAGNFAVEIKSKHIAWSALAHAISNIEEHVASDVYPNWQVLAPQGTAPFASTNPNVRLAVGTASDYVPGILYAVASTADCDWVVDGYNPEWPLARYSYLVLNCSGLLDANHIGGRDRNMGESAREIQLANLNGVDFVNEDDFVVKRDEHLRYESRREMVFLNEAVEWDSMHLVTDSLATIAPDVVFLSTNMADYADAQYRGEIEQAFVRSGLSTKDAETALAMLLDYIEPGSVPGRLDGPCGKAVPLINEVILEYMLNVSTNGVYTYGYQVFVEWAFPFAAMPSNVSFQLDYDVEVEALPNNDHVELVPSGVSTNGPLSGVIPGAYASVPAGQLTPNAYTTTNPVTVAFSVQVKGEVLANGDAVDKVPADSGKDGITFDVVLPGVGPGFTTQITKWVECVDPRFNWDPSNADYGQYGINPQWMPGEMLEMLVNDPTVTGYTPAPSPAEENGYAQWVLANPGHPASAQQNFDADSIEGAYSYVANRPLKSVGELGFLVLRPWYTIRLFDHDESQLFAGADPYGGQEPYHRVLDHFAIGDRGSQRTVNRGLVNVNTDAPDVLAAVFHDAPLDEYAANPSRLTSAQAVDISNWVAQEIAVTGFMTNLSAIGSITNWAQFGSTKIEREGPIRNSADLLTTRQNLFTILLMGGPAGQGMGERGRRIESHFGMRRAVAVVWRDPFPIEGTGTDSNADPARHRYVLRYFNWLDE